MTEQWSTQTSVANVWFAPLLRRYLTTESWFSWAAMYSGVNPFCDCAFTEASRCTNNCTTSSCPAEKEKTGDIGVRQIFIIISRERKREKETREVYGKNLKSSWLLWNKCLFKITLARPCPLYISWVAHMLAHENGHGWEKDKSAQSNHSPREAMCNAVFPFLVAASTIAPRFMSSFTISKWPSLAARCKAFKPFCKRHKHFTLCYANFLLYEV